MRACTHTHTHSFWQNLSPSPGSCRVGEGGAVPLYGFVGKPGCGPLWLFFPFWPGEVQVPRGGCCSTRGGRPGVRVPVPCPACPHLLNCPAPAHKELRASISLTLPPLLSTPCCLPCPRLLFFPPCLFLPPTCPNPEPALFREPLQMQRCSGFAVAWTWRAMAIFSLQPSAA